MDEQQIAFAEALEDPRFTQLVEHDFHTVGEAETKLCFLCKSPSHLAEHLAPPPTQAILRLFQ